MARMDPLDRADAHDELDQVFAVKEASLGFVPNSALTIARWPELATAYGHLSAAIAAPRRLPAVIKNLVFLMASTAAGCRYCQAHSASTAAGAGLGDKVAAAWEFESSPLFTEAERAAMRLGLAAGHSPSLVTDDHFDDLRRHFDDDEILEMVGVIAFSGFMNRWNATMATQLEEEPLWAARRYLKAGGWEPGAHGQA